jgi:parallel beta-helix repeat protein
MKKLFLILSVFLAVSVLASIPCSAQAQNAQGQNVVYGCYQRSTGQVRIVDNLKQCDFRSELPMFWRVEIGPTLVSVNCSQGQTISKVLHELVGFTSPVTIQVNGTCNESVDISRDDVTLIGGPSGGAIKGPDPNRDTVSVRGARTIIDSLTVTGGRNAITVSSGDAAIQNSTVKNAGSVGIYFVQRSSGIVDNCTVQNNPLFGIRISDGGAAITNSTISANYYGISVSSGSIARIGLTNNTAAGGNTITNNSQYGIFIVNGGSADIYSNTISGNGIYGISLLDATARLLGGNQITGNGVAGLLVQGSHVRIGEPIFVTQWGLSTSHNTITGNGAGSATSPNRGGIWAHQSASVFIDDADVSNNTGSGINVSACSTVLFSAPANLPPVNVTGNTQFGLLCSFGGSPPNTCNRIAIGLPPVISGNLAGDISPNCQVVYP